MNLRRISTQPILRRCGFCLVMFALVGVAHVLSIANPSGEWQAFFPKCMFFLATGLHCPGCGCQRAIHHLFNGRILLALQYNAMVIIALPWLTWEAVRATLLFLELPVPRILAVRWRLSGRQAMSIAIAVMAFWILRNIPCRPFEWLAPPVSSPKPNDKRSQAAIPVARVCSQMCMGKRKAGQSKKGSAKMRWETVELMENVSKTEFLHSNLRGAKDAKRILNSTATG